MHETVLQFKTTGKSAPLLPLTSDNVFVLEDLELAFPRKQLSEITKRWNKGEELEDIAKSIERNPDEVFLALFHQSRYDRTKRPFAWRYKK